ncbi:MAG: ABC transporter ATP-binding protein [Deltaproteobacteria bacterium]|nr:MAG: ABC transporter ATP-binding protein [Deltaproteobacteria bacterium]
MLVVFRFARQFLTPYLWWYVGGIVALIVTNWIAVTIPVVTGEAVDALRHGDPDGVVFGKAMWIAGLGVAVIVARTLSRVAFFTPGRLAEAAVKSTIFDLLLRQQPAYHAEWATGDLVSRASSDVNYVRLLAGFGALQVCNTVLAVGLVSVRMATMSPWLAFLVLGPVAIGLAFALLFIGRMFRLVHEMQQALSELSDLILSSYRGVATIQGFGAEAAFQERFEVKNQEHLRASLLRAQMRAAIGPVLSLTTSINVFLLLFVGGPMAVTGEISTGELIAFTMLIAYVSGPLRSVSFLLAIFKQSQAAIERVNEVLDPVPERPDLPEPAPAPHQAPHIAVRHLTFAYPQAPDETVLHDVSVDIPAGSTLGIFGPTGSGKTTLLRCIARLYNPEAGQVLIGDSTESLADIRDIDLDAYRERLAFVPQRAFLFSEALRDNVLLGAPDDGRLERVVELAALEQDVEALPRGLDTQVGESGVMLSGGQRQRTALARGLVRPHGLLVLDDVLSAVDHKTEAQLLDALRKGEPRTTLIVANRISALAHADQILVLQDGKVTGLGTHRELCEQEGIYRDTWLRQREEADATGEGA